MNHGLSRIRKALYTTEEEEEGNKKLGFLKRNLKINNPDIKSCAYKTLVRPTLEYCSTVWDPHTAKAALQLEMVKCRAARWVKNDYVQQSSVTQMPIDLKWRDLGQRRTDARLSLRYKIVHNLILIEGIKYVKLQRTQDNHLDHPPSHGSR